MKQKSSLFLLKIVIYLGFLEIEKVDFFFLF